ncbi:hypothetical protein [Lysobacter gummosus]|uniref:hypothetical protein n=1 Tax=Lysobacter gummosus TaxID=262324 RepID=UPI003637DDED
MRGRGRGAVVQAYAHAGLAGESGAGRPGRAEAKIALEYGNFIGYCRPWAERLTGHAAESASLH